MEKVNRTQRGSGPADLSRVIAARLTEAEADIVTSVARERGVTKSNLVRGFVVGGLTAILSQRSQAQHAEG